MRSGFLLLYLALAIISLTHCDAERSMRGSSKGAKHGRILTHEHAKKLRIMALRHFDFSSLEFSNAQSVDSSSPLPPYESLAPIPLPQNSPPTGLQLPPPGPTGSLPTPTPQSIPNSPGMSSPLQNPPIIIPGPPGSPGSMTSPPTSNSPPSVGTMPGSPEPMQNPPIVLPSPSGSTISPPSTIPSPSGGTGPGSPEPIQNPPGSTMNPPSTISPPSEGTVPGSPEPIQNPPIILPGPPGSTPIPPNINPSPPAGGGGGVPSPIVFEPPVVYPPPSVPPPPSRMAPSGALWCVVKPSVPDPIMQEAMNYACGLGADCDPIRPNGPCFEPDTVIEHTSFVFNSFWQNSKATGGNCDFGGTGMLVSEDPSYDGCHFVYS